MDDLCKEKILSNDYADWIIDFELTDWIKGLDEKGVEYCYDKIDDTLGLIYAKRDEIEEVGLLNYSYQQIPSLLTLPEVLTEEVGNNYEAEPWFETGSIPQAEGPLRLTGKNTVIALIGTGVDYTSPLFRRRDGSSRILAIWDQNIREGTPPATATYGREYKKEEIDRALEQENPFLSVPTGEGWGLSDAVAAIAAGSDITTPEVYGGAAPEADLVIVKLKECKPYLRDYYLLPPQATAYQSTDIIKALQYADSFVKEFYRPVVFCLTLGTNYGAHSGTSPLSRYLERLGEKRGRTVIISGGEEGNKRHHYFGILEGEKSQQEIELRVGSGEKGFLTEIWGSMPGSLRVAVKAPSGEQLQVDSIQEARGTSYGFIYERTRLTVTYGDIDPATGDQLIVLRIENPKEGIWTLLIEGKTEGISEEFHIWLPNTEFLSSETYFLRPDPDITLMVPSFVSNAICTTSYATQTGSFYAQSGRGFTRGSFRKPELAAPAVGITVPVTGLLGQLRLGKMTSTAFSAAFTTGAVAQFLQWAYQEGGRNYLNGNEVKSFFLAGAKREDGRTYPNREWGYGKLSLTGVFDFLAGL